MPSSSARLRRKRVDTKKSVANENETKDSTLETTAFKSKTLKESQCQNSMNGTTVSVTGSSRGGRALLNSVVPIFEAVQSSRAKIGEALSKLEQLYESEDKRAFSDVLWRLMIVPFTIPKGNPKADLFIELFHRAITSIGNDVEAQGNNVLALRILRLCIKYHREQRLLVRFRVAETIAKILKHMEAVVPPAFKEYLVEVLLERLQDKHHSVRLQTVFSLGYLRLHSDQSKSIRRISTALVFSMISDPNFEIRKEAVRSLQIDRNTIERIVEKVNDHNDNVRIAALSVISEKIPIRALTISQRECILLSSLKNSSAAVKKHGITLLHKWMETCEGNLCELLQKLDVIENNKLCFLVLNTLFTEANSDNYEKIDKSFIVDKFIPLENLTMERSFLWLFLISKFADDPYYKEKLIPESSQMFSYIRMVLDQPTNEDSAVEKMQCVITHILLIMNCIRLEEGSRRQIKEAISAVFCSQHLCDSHIPILINLLHNCYLDEKEEGMMIIVNKILEPPSNDDDVSNLENGNPVMDEEHLMELKIELAGIMHQRHKRKRDQDTAINNQEFLVAQECHVEIESLMQRENVIKEKLNTVNTQIDNCLLDESGSENPTSVEYPPRVMCLALSAVIVHVQIVQFVSAQVRQFYEHRVLKCIFTFEEANLRKKALQLISLVGFHNKEDAVKAMIFCIQGALRDETVVQVGALKCVFDLILQFSFEDFENTAAVMQLLATVTNNSKEDDGMDEFDTASLKKFTMSFLESKETDLLNVAVAGVIKLLLSNKLHSPRIVCILLLMWANPANLQTKIYKDVQAWLPIYANTGLTQGNLIANAVVPCINKILTAKRSSPLSDAPIDKFVAFILQSTDPKSLEPASWAANVHKIVAADVVTQMIVNIANPSNHTYAKILKQVDLQLCDVGYLGDMLKRCRTLLRDPNRYVKSIITEFIEHLKSLGGVPKGNWSEDSDSDSSDHQYPALQQTCLRDSLNANKVFSSSEDEEMEVSNKASKTISAVTARRVSSSDDDSLYGPTPPQ